MGGYENFRMRMETGGSTQRTEVINNTQRLLEFTFADDPSYIEEGVTIYGTNRVIKPRINQQKFRLTSPFQASFQTLLHEPVYLGDVIPWPNRGYWICVESQNFHGMNWEGTLQFCNFFVRFLSPLSGEIIEYPVSMQNATQYGSGESPKPMMTLGSSQHLVSITCDEHTSLLKSGQRFLLDKNVVNPTAYRVTQIDTTSFAGGDVGSHGYLQLTVVEDRFNEKTDNRHEMIADMYKDETASGDSLHEQPDKWI